MTWESLFASQWRTMQSRLETELTNAKRSKSPSIQHAVDREFAKWFDSSHQAGAWLSEFTFRYPELGATVRGALSEFRLSSPSSENSSTLSDYAPVIAGASAVGAAFVVMRVIAPSMMFLQLAVTGVAGVVASPIAAQAVRTRANIRTDQSLKPLFAELTTLEQRLRKTIAKADEAEHGVT